MPVTTNNKISSHNTISLILLTFAIIVIILSVKSAPLEEEEEAIIDVKFLVVQSPTDVPPSEPRFTGLFDFVAANTFGVNMFKSLIGKLLKRT